MAGAQTIFGQPDALALELVDGLNAASSANTFCLSLSARRVFARHMDIAELPKVGDPVDVQVFPGHEQGDRVGIAGVYDDIYGVHVLFQQFVDVGQEAQCALLLQLRSQVIEFLLSKQVDATSAVHPFKAVAFSDRHGPEGVYDLRRLEELKAFYSDLILTYKAPGLRRT